ncbi:MAG TPA: NAD(P)H-hydrate dehydratase [Azospirillaceae bacterium]|nr:NAD(P)H-hydrate dehydratase [Azospirillaceae bacterium]
MPRPSALLTVAEMAEADRLAIAGGTPGTVLMEAAGRAVAQEIRARWTARPTVVVCGPGNNGGDGFVVARHLAEAGWPVAVQLLGDPAALKGDAAWAAAGWSGPVGPVHPDGVVGAGLVVDALFGAGLSRPLEGVAKAVVEAMAGPVVAIDVPSGVHGDTGDVMGAAPAAALTVTFFRRKPGHLLFPGRLRCGEVVVRDIGIADTVLDAIRPLADENGPVVWGRAVPRQDPAGHKYGRGHVVVLGGGRMTGAARLSARAAQRIGAGLVTVAVPGAALPVYAAALEGPMVRAVDGPRAFARLLGDRRLGPVLIGPGAGRGPLTRLMVEAAAGAGKDLVLDADALTVFAGDATGLAQLLAGRAAVLTPHGGEFLALFGPDGGSRLDRARRAAARVGAVVVFKGPDTVVAAPDGRAVVNANAPPDLATGGTGDVLAGMVLGLMGQGMAPFEAASAAVWLHGAAAARLGPGLIADDLPDAVPPVLRGIAPNSAPPSFSC